VGAGRPGAVVEIAADGVFVVMMVLVAVIVVMRMTVRRTVGMHMVVVVPMNVAVLALMHVLMDMDRAVGMGVAVGMCTGQRSAVVTVRMLVFMAVAVRMHRAVLVDVGVLMRPTLDFRFPCAAAANCTHCLVSVPIRFRFL
jgi:hypothetical protein